MSYERLTNEPARTSRYGAVESGSGSHMRSTSVRFFDVSIFNSNFFTYGVP